jgi:hypothetical protein
MREKDRKHRIELNLKNVAAIGDGKYSGLECPECGKAAMEAYFTINADRSRYGVWFECTNCKNFEHLSCSKMPVGFIEDRISERFQSLDIRAWNAEDIDKNT